MIIKNKVLLYIILVIFLVIVAIFLSNSVVNKEKNEDKNSEKHTTKKLNPFGTTFEKVDTEEINFLEYIHWMSHQKVKAEDKWGFYEITNERIDWLLSALEETEHQIVYYAQYKDILMKWKNLDYSTIVEDHNFVWEKLGGLDEGGGKATGILTEEDEQNYIENTEEVN